MILFLTYLILLWSVNAWHDADFYNKVDAHLSGAILACFIGIGFLILPFIGLAINDIWQLINLVILVFTVRWIVFDISYNLFIKQKWYFVGNTSWMDKNIPNWIQFTLKIFCLFIDFPIIYCYVK